MNRSTKDLKRKMYQCRYCGRTRGTYTGEMPRGQCPARPKPKVGIAPHCWRKIN